ncbi:MAG: cyclic nucleotide-binding domain-containing protein [Myxococcota bacterium]|nr:cyclic nucleotide-binding domain-containing protein [Myxococcota bacterium]
MENDYLWWAVALGALSAISLPLGSLLGLSWQPSNKITAGLTAFGGGALIAALSIELVAPTALKLTQSGVSPEDLHHNVQALLSLIAGAVVGGGLFLTLDAIINSKGGFLRKTATTIAYFSGRKAARRRAVINHLAESELIRHVPIEVVEEMVDHVSSQEIESGSQLFAEGDEGDAIYFIETGEITLSHGDEAFAQLDAGEVLGEIALITGAARTATATAKIDTRLLRLEKSDFDELRQQYSDLEEAAQNLAQSRLEELVAREKGQGSQDAVQWAHNALAAMPAMAVVPTAAQLHEASEEHHGAPMAIWLGIMLDGIPESFVIGSALAAGLAATLASDPNTVITFNSVVPYTLIAGLFLSNFPEAMSSSIGMKKQGWGNLRVFLMWSSLMLLTSIGSALGYSLGESLGHVAVVGIEGLAAGAMLTMIASAMIPEAIHLGGARITGMATLCGFLAAISFKLMEIGGGGMAH